MCARLIETSSIATTTRAMFRHNFEESEALIDNLIRPLSPTLSLYRADHSSLILKLLKEWNIWQLVT